MRHQCTVCLRAFVDDSGGLPESERVHCVFCGATIPLRRNRRRQDRVRAVPFSKDAQREEAFALGVIGAGNVGFPDTLRQFRVRPTADRPNDTLMPVFQEGGTEPLAPEASPPPWRLASFWASLAVGLAVGVAVASAATSMARQRRASSAAVTALPVASSAASPRKSPPPSPSPVVAPAVVASPPSFPDCGAVPPAASAAVAAAPVSARRAVSPELDRRWLLERARSRQRAYHLTDAERLYRQVLSRAPNDSEALSGLGEVELLRGTTELAGARFREALSVNADYIPALIAVADLHWAAGRGAEAQQAYRSIVDSYDAELYPPYVAQRSVAPLPPDCGQQ